MTKDLQFQALRTFWISFMQVLHLQIRYSFFYMRFRSHPRYGLHLFCDKKMVHQVKCGKLHNIILQLFIRSFDVTLPRPFP